MPSTPIRPTTEEISGERTEMIHRKEPGLPLSRQVARVLFPNSESGRLVPSVYFALSPAGSRIKHGRFHGFLAEFTMPMNEEISRDRHDVMI